ncbi:MAG: DUF4406 domain-containing protein [Bacteroidales bacterium]|nr:DUF4406 domain-containing protein [Bacteroidales bacterium]
MRIYIIGKVSGEKLGDVFVKFNTVEYNLKRKGYEVVNPLRLCASNWCWEKCMEVCISELLKCDAIYALPDWKESRGAQLEHYIARQLGMQILSASYFRKQLRSVFVETSDINKCRRCIYRYRFEEICEDYGYCYPEQRKDKKNGYYESILL